MPPVLSRTLLAELARSHYTVDTPDETILDLPERILQFGTGRFLRGFIDYFVDKANRAGVFDGRILAVSTTGSGRDSALARQDGLYTLIVRGLDGGRALEHFTICASISRALSAQDSWDEIRMAARSEALRAVVSNTTEVGIQADPLDTPDDCPPRSFPAKLTSLLLERGRHFDYAPQAGLIVLPCELIENNGDALLQVVLDLSRRWNLPGAFISWVESHCLFCNTLVDRIVTGVSAGGEQASLAERLGYTDDLLTIAEVYRLYAVEGPSGLVERLPFLGVDEGIFLSDDIRPYRERKIRILNGTHTIMTPLALMSGLDTVLQAVSHPDVGRFVRHVMLREIVPSLDAPGGHSFAAEVLDRFANPLIDHPLLNITLQSTTKMRHRVVPSIRAYVERHGEPPKGLLFGFACYLVFMRATRKEGDRVFGEHSGRTYSIQDDRALHLFDLWQGVDILDASGVAAFSGRVLGDKSLWDVDLRSVPGLVEGVARALLDIHRVGVPAALTDLLKELD